MSSADQLYLVSLPFTNSADPQPSAQFSALQRQMGPALGAALRHFIIPNLKVGTLDTLMEASDELTKLDPQMEGTVFKLCSLLEEASSKSRSAVAMLRLNQQSHEITCENYLKIFAWNSAQFDNKESIKTIIDKLTQVTSGAEERVRVLLTEYSETRAKLQSASRKGQGNLAVRPIGDAVRKYCQQQRQPDNAPINSEFLVQMFVAVPITLQKDWQESYWKMHEFVCPGSSHVVAQDNEYILNSVVLFKRCAEDFKMGCRKRKFNVRELDAEDDLTADALQQLQSKADQEKSSLIALLTQQFSQCFVAWTHCKALRVYVESLLKYGLPPRFVPVLLAVDSTKETQIRAKLKSLYADLHTPLDEDQSVDTGALQYEFPYVSVKIANLLGKR